MTDQPEEIERQFLADRGIKAKPGIARRHLLPHEGGDFSYRLRRISRLRT